jgi:hypothetical protein
MSDAPIVLRLPATAFLLPYGLLCVSCVALYAGFFAGLDAEDSVLPALIGLPAVPFFMILVAREHSHRVIVTRDAVMARTILDRTVIALNDIDRVSAVDAGSRTQVVLDGRRITAEDAKSGRDFHVQGRSTGERITLRGGMVPAAARARALEAIARAARGD